MSEYKTINIINKSLNKKQWNDVIVQIGKFDRVLFDDKKITCGGYSTTKTEYSIDSGSITTKYDKAILAIKRYLGKELIEGVEII